MHDESDFLRKLLDDPADDTTRLVYADWLDERGDGTGRAKSEFLRLTARQLDPNRPEGDDEELQRLAAEIDADWLAVVSRLKVESCGAKRAASEIWEFYRRQFEFVCDKRWDELTPTEDSAVRFCDGCKKNVHYCDTIATARRHAGQGHCIAVDLGVTRVSGDLTVCYQDLLVSRRLRGLVIDYGVEDIDNRTIDDFKIDGERREQVSED